MNVGVSTIPGSAFSPSLPSDDVGDAADDAPVERGNPREISAGASAPRRSSAWLAVGAGAADTAKRPADAPARPEAARCTRSSAGGCQRDDGDQGLHVCAVLTRGRWRRGRAREDLDPQSDAVTDVLEDAGGQRAAAHGLLGSAPPSPRRR